LRSSGLSYAASDTNRWNYGILQRDAATGLDHAGWRKLESFSGRWTSPDPYGGSMTNANPRSFNRYAYVQNDPVNVIDPDGLDVCFGPIRFATDFPNLDSSFDCPDSTKSGGSFGGGGGDGRGGGGGINQKPKKNTTPLDPQKAKRSKACEAKKQLQKCEKDAREKYAFAPHGPSLDDGKLITGEDLGLGGAGGGVAALLRLLGGARLAAAVASGGESLAVSVLISSGWRQYQLGRAHGAAMQKAYDEEQSTIAKCRADFEKTVKEAGYNPQDVLNQQEWNNCY